jgi:hypothetical protein
VIELYKSGPGELPKNYRPISLLPIIAKIFDTLINNQIMKHLLHHNIISTTQYAFRPKSGTTLALQTILNNIHKNVRKKQPTLAIYIDLSKSYDTIAHDKLLHILEHEFKFTPDSVSFFTAYFQNRIQSTHTQHAKSKPQIITHGIPQGSTLSTTFFLLYINDIIKTVPKSKVYTYADDTTLIITADTVEHLHRLAQTELSSLIKYFHNNNLVPNPTKTNYTIFHPKTTKTINLNINGTNITQNPQSKLLSITVQDDRKHNTIIKTIMKKLQPVIQKLRYATQFLPTKSMKQLYYNHAYPHLAGETTVWGTDDTTKTYIQPLIKIQKKLIRIMCNLPPRAHTKPLMTKHEILNITNIHIHRVCTEIHPYIHQTHRINQPEHDHKYT